MKKSAHQATTGERFNAILDYALTTKGQILWSKLTEAERERQRDRWRDSPRLPGFRVDCVPLCGARYAAEEIGVTYPSMKELAQQCRALTDFCQAYVARHGRDAEVRVRTDLLFEARDGGGIRPDEFAVLAAIYSVIGRKNSPVRITQNTILRRALGYRTAVIQGQELPRRRDGARPLSQWRLRHLIDLLHERKLFDRCTCGRRLTYYSHRLSQKQMEKLLIDHHTRRAGFRAIRRAEDEQLTQAIRDQRAIFEGKRPPPEPV